MPRFAWNTPHVACALVALAVLTALAARPARGQPSPHVVQTEPLSAAEQQTKFHLPPGFEIQLVVAEPTIQKPINLAFDAQGRLHVSHTIEYPFAAKEGEGRDGVSRLTDGDGDGVYEKVETLVDKLNIPIGVLPHRNGVIVFSIPKVYDCQDTDGDGRIDQRRVLFEGFGQDDTHGLNNAFRRGPDGWVYAAHGFRNVSNITNGRGAELTLRSGNTYRFSPDGAALEQFTFGQVNPFGLFFDPWGDLFSADCHTKPAYLLLRGGEYPHFGNQPSGLGFAPELMAHLHGSTGIAGVVVYHADNFPEEYRGTLLVGNPLTHRLNRDRLEPRGAGYRGVEQPDFLKCDDPWFRPVDLRVGPDGALYVADFYNRIIGHYEVDLKHPLRDRERGRIWRIVYTGSDPSAKPPRPAPNLNTTSLAETWRRLADPNLTVREHALHACVDRFGAEAGDYALARLSATEADQAAPEQRAAAAWILQRTGKFTAEARRALGRDASPLARTHAARAAAAELDRLAGVLARGASLRPEAGEGEGAAANTALVDSAQAEIGAISSWLAEMARDESPLARRAVAEALGRAPRVENAKTLLRMQAAAPADDVFLRYTLRVALRNQLMAREAFPADWADALAEADLRALADAAAAAPREAAAQLLLSALERLPLASGDRAQYLRHLTRHAPAGELERVVALVRRHTADRPEEGLALLEALAEGLQQRGAAPTEAVKSWASEVATRALSDWMKGDPAWRALSLDDAPAADARWGLEERQCDDGQRAKFLSSLPGGERLTGKLRSPSFTIPARLNFYLCGHLGHTGGPAIEKNLVRLVRSDTGAVIAEALPPRSDVARHVAFDLAAHVGKVGHLEIVDGLSAEGYAWLAVSRFEPPVVNWLASDVAETRRQQRAATHWIALWRLEAARPLLEQAARGERRDAALRGAALRALTAFRPSAAAVALAELVEHAELTPATREAIVAAVLADDPAAGGQGAATLALPRIARGLSGPLQARLAAALAGSRAGGELLLAAVGQGALSARLLADPGLRQKLAAAETADLDARLAALTRDLPPASEAVARLIAQRRQEFASAPRAAARGKAAFAKHCAACHKIGGEGAKIGPELDGVGRRGLERLLEDVLDPNRNLDPAFRATTVLTAGGQVLTGLALPDEGETAVLVDNQGKTQRVPKSEVADRKLAPLSPMPGNLGETIPASEFHDLLEFLLTTPGQP